MVRKKDHHIFWGRVTGTIDWLLEDHPHIFAVPSVLITCIDSMGDLRGFHEIVKRDSPCTLFGKSLVIPGDKIVGYAEEFNLFNGFDEIWLLNREPYIEKPDSFSLVPPVYLEEEIDRGMVEWMIKIGCILGLGGGIGLNYVTSQKDIAETLEKNYPPCDSSEDPFVLPS